MQENFWVVCPKPSKSVAISLIGIQYMSDLI